MPKILGVIPARYASSRFPGKPLIEIEGKSMIQRVYEQALKATCLDKVYIATDDKRIQDHVQNFGGNALMTATTIRSGTERVAAIAEKFSQYKYFINIQGDEPYIDPQQIDLLGATLTQYPETKIATLVKPIQDSATLLDPKYAKVVLSADGYAIYFSRSPIPHCFHVKDIAHWIQHHTYYKHISVYGFQREVLLQIPQMPEVAAETIESLEQLRWLGNGYRIKIAITATETVSIDTPEDLARLKQLKED